MRLTRNTENILNDRETRVSSTSGRDRRKLRFFCARVVISELLITIQRTEIDASMLGLSDHFFHLQDMLMAQVIIRVPLSDFDRIR